MCVDICVDMCVGHVCSCSRAGEMPYFELKDDERVISHVMAGGRLSRPAEASRGEYDALWRIVESCWAEHAAVRPTFSQLSVSLGQLPTFAHVRLTF